MSLLPVSMGRGLRQRRDLEAGAAAASDDGDFVDRRDRRRGAAPKEFKYSGIPLVNSLTVPIAIILILVLQYLKILGGIATLMSLSVVVAITLRPPKYTFKYLTGASLGVRVCAVAFYLFLVSLATFGLLLASLATCHHCTCKWTAD